MGLECSADSVDAHEREVASGERFDFGANWRSFLRRLTDTRIEASTQALLAKLQCRDLQGKTFLDVGSGSGLSSLAAYRAGAQVFSFDFDPQCVACTKELRRRGGAGDDRWRVVRGSVLDSDFMMQLGTFDVVYSWGVLHHTGAMWQALENTAARVAPGGLLFIALYNDQGLLSRYWLTVKRLYNRSKLGKVLMIAIHVPYFVAARAVGNLVRAIRRCPRETRGMAFWTDVLDWLGGLPFEVATPEKVIRFLEQREFRSLRVFSVGRKHGCNEFIFERIT